MIIPLIICIIFFITVAYLVLTGAVNKLDQAFSKKIIGKRTNTLTQIMHFFTNIGKGRATLIICIALLILPGLDNILSKTAGFSALSTILLSHLFKNLIKRARPEGNRLVEETDYSFPSAHALTAAALYGGILLNTSGFIQPINWIVITACILMIFFIGFSRVYLGIHYLFDVIGGWSLGLVTALTFTIFFTT